MKTSELDNKNFKTKDKHYIDKNGDVYPWFNPMSFDLLESIVNPLFNVFEWGAGYGTLWWGKYTNSILAIEHNKDWYNKINDWIVKVGLHNTSIKYIPIKTQRELYPKIIKEQKNKFDLIVIDGKDRVDCAKYAKDMIKEYGWIILDNSDRLDLYPIRESLKDWEAQAMKTRAGWGTTFYQNRKGKYRVQVTTMFKHAKMQEKNQLHVSREGGIKPPKGWILDSILRKFLPKNILEIGFNQGRSAMLMLEVLSKSKVTSIDICKHDCAEYNANIMKGLYKNFSFIKGNSKDVLKNTLNKIRNIDFALVDGGHDYKTCKFDIENCLRHLSEKGVIYIDDYNKYNSITYKAPGVEQACDEIKKRCNWKLYSEEGIMLLSKGKLPNGI